MINQAWLTTFCTLCEVGHFTKTAERLYMTQSGVSQHIKKLEQQLDCELLIREGKRFKLTAQGNRLFEQGKQLLNQFKSLEQSLVDNEAHRGEVNVMSPGSLGLKLYPYLLDLQAQYPELVINYRFAPNSQIERGLIDNSCDVGLMTQSGQQELLQSASISKEQLVLITGNNTKTLDWDVLTELGFVSHPDGVHHGNLLLSKNFSLFSHMSQFKQVGFSNQISMILEPISRNIGFTVLPISAVQAFSAQEKIHVHSTTTAVYEDIYLCHARQALDSKRCQFVREKVTSFLAE